MSAARRRAPGILLVHADWGVPYAATVGEHVEAFGRYSAFPVTRVNTALGFPPGLPRLRFDVLLLHYSLFGIHPYAFDDRFRAYFAECGSTTVAFFQDEYRFCRERAAFVGEVDVDLIYTLVEPERIAEVYPRHAREGRAVYTLPGHVGPRLLAAARRFARPDAERTVDVAYRARSVPYYLGRAGQEKDGISRAFGARAAGTGLRLDLDADQSTRLYGDDWWRFLGNARATLGIEGGASAFDLDGRVYEEHQRLLAADPSLTFEEYEARAPALREVDYRLPSLMITPRHLEAAAFRCCQILYEGRYSGMLRPVEHYIPLRKDLSNFDEAIRMFRDDDLRRTIAENAHRNLVASGALAYERLVADLDRRLRELGVPVPAGRRSPAAGLRVGQAGRRGRRWTARHAVGLRRRLGGERD